MSWFRARYLVSVCLPSPGRSSSLTPALAQLAWIAWAMSVIGELLRTSMVTLKPFGQAGLGQERLGLGSRSNL